nr:MAG TPA: hypothetical protein [Caudoviricetes sp.]
MPYISLLSFILLYYPFILLSMHCYNNAHFYILLIDTIIL